MGNSSESKPQKEASDREEMLWRDKEGIDQEEPSQEVNQKKALLVKNCSKSFVALPYFPFSDGLSTFASEPIVSSDS